MIKTYLKAGGIRSVIISLAFHLIFSALIILGQIWLSLWADDPKDLPADEQRERRNMRLGGYGAIIAAQSRFKLCSVLVFRML